MLTFAVEPWLESVSEIVALGPEHYEEVSQFQGQHPYDLDFRRLAALAATGALHCVVARSAGRVVGYHIAIVERLLHYREILAAQGDVYFLKREFRNGRNALRLFEAANTTLAARGVQIQYDVTKLSPGNDHHELLTHLSYSPVERRYSKWLR